jgi:hypothetical protein
MGAENQDSVLVVNSGSSQAIPVELQTTPTIDIGDVTVIQNIPGVTATDLGKAVDAVAGSTDTGVSLLAVRKDSVASGVADGDYTPLYSDSSGRLYVAISGTVTVDGSASTQPVSQATASSLNMTEASASAIKTAVEGTLATSSVQATLNHAQVSVSASAVQIGGASSVPLKSGITILADSSNSGTIYVGASSSVSTTNGFPLAAGAALELSLSDLNIAYCISDASSQTIHYVAL